MLGTRESTTLLPKLCGVLRIAFVGSAMSCSGHSLCESQQTLRQFLCKQQKSGIASQIDGNQETNENSYPRRLLQLSFPVYVAVKRQLSHAVCVT